MPSGAQCKKQKKAAKVSPADCLAATTEPMDVATTPATEDEFVKVRFREEEVVAWGGFHYLFHWPSSRGVVYRQLVDWYEEAHDAYMFLTEAT